MKKSLNIALCLMMVTVLMAFASGCGGGSPSSEESATPAPSAPAEPAASEPAAAEPATSEPAAQEPAASTEAPQSTDSAAPAASGDMTSAPAAQDAAPATAPAAGGPLTAETLVGTKWSVGGMTFSFEKDGVLKVNDQIPGTWSVDGSTLKVSAMGNEYSATIDGDKISYQGSPLQRAN